MLCFSIVILSCINPGSGSVTSLFFVFESKIYIWKKNELGKLNFRSLCLDNDLIYIDYLHVFGPFLQHTNLMASPCTFLLALVRVLAVGQEVQVLRVPIPLQPSEWYVCFAVDRSGKINSILLIG